MKKTLLTLTTVFSLFTANSALACSFFIDDARVNAELTKVAVASLGDVEVLSAEATDMNWVISKPTIMCPEELTYNAKIDVVYESGLNQCAGQLTIKKIESWTSDENTYQISGSNSFRCKK